MLTLQNFFIIDFISFLIRNVSRALFKLAVVVPSGNSINIEENQCDFLPDIDFNFFFKLIFKSLNCFNSNIKNAYKILSLFTMSCVC